MTRNKSTPFQTCTGNPKAPPCPYCGQPSVFHESSAKFYRGTDYGPVWACEPCEAWVGCHPGRKVALGRLANKELRRAKMAAHEMFDPLWKVRRRLTRDRWSRAQAYKWLAAQLGIDRKDCHIGMFDADQCRRVVEVCRPYRESLRGKSDAEIRVKPRTVEQEALATP